MSALSWVYYVIGVSVLLGVGALLLEETLRAAGRGGRWAWLVCLAGSLALSLSALLAPAPSAPSPVGEVLGAPVLVLAPLVSGMERVGPDLGVLLRWGWGLASSVLLGVLGLSYLALRREAARWRAVRLDDAEVWVSADTGPAVVGLRRPRIVLPEWVLSLGEADRRLMVLHEQEHVRARDPGVLLLALLGSALLPWNPVVWWALHRLRSAIELDCDARVLARAGDPAGYGRLLLEVGRRRSERYLLAAAFAEPRVLLERRVRALLQWPRGRRPLAASVLGGAALLFFGFAYVAPIPLARAEPAPLPLLDRGLSAVQDTPPPAQPPVTEGPRLRNGEEVRRLQLVEMSRAMRDARESGVVVAVLIDETGRVAEARVSQSSGRTELDAAALRVARQMEFTPARNNGQAVSRWWETPIVFGSPADAGVVLGDRIQLNRPAADSTRIAVDPRQNMRPDTVPSFTPMTVRPELTNSAEVQRLLMAEYPPLLRDAGIGGNPIVWFLIDETGRVTRTQLSKSSGYEALDAAALRVGQRMQFTPAENRGVPVSVWVEIPLVFRAQSGEGEGSRSAALVQRDVANMSELQAALVRNYPPLLRDAGIGGRVVVWFYADESGQVTKRQLAKPSGYEELDEAAMKLAEVIRFVPAASGGWVEVPIVFSAK